MKISGKSICAVLMLLLLPHINSQGKSVRQDIFPASAKEADVPDSARLAEIPGKVKEYLTAIETEPVEVLKRETDFLIQSCSDSLVRQAVALNIYDFYLKSNVMGTEAVAVYICDKWFIPGKIKMHSDIDLMNARIFAEFNRSSLIGMQAPELEVIDSLDNPVKLFSNIGDCPTASGRYSILFFYSTDCPRCLAESIMLRNILENSDFPADLYAINTGRNRTEWLEYVKTHLDIKVESTNIFHLWDPQTISGFQLKYGILQTPGMFLIDPTGKIIGRKLDSISLEKLLKTELETSGIEYGSDESIEFYDRVFAPYGDSLECKDVISMSSYIARTSLERGNTMMFKQMTGDLLYYLAGKKEKAYKCGLEHIINTYILDNAVWNTPEDSIKIRDFASIMQEMLDRCRPGTRIHDVKVPGVLLTKGKDGKAKEKEGNFRLASFGGQKRIIIFYTEGCQSCNAEKDAARKLLSENAGRKTRVLEVNIDLMFSSYPDLAQELFDCFDLIALPFIVGTDSRGIVTDRYMSLVRK